MNMIARPWAFWRRMQYGSGFLVIVLLCLYWGYATFLYSAPTCFDNRQNSDERGVDCGGGCMLICAMDVTQPVVKWARSFEVTSGQYNAVAYVENLNPAAGAPRIDYTFTLYDAQGVITERSGTSFLPPGSVYPIFEGRITTGGRVPTQTFLEIQPVSTWLPVTAGREQFNVINRELLSADTQPRLNATVENTALTQSNNVEVVATIFDAQGNALTASQTYIDRFAPRTQENIVFTWPLPIAKTIRSCEVPTDVVIAIDLSGSMNNDQAAPPEPISSVKAAAQEFAGRLGSGDQAALVTFATNAVIDQSFTTGNTVKSKIASLTIAANEEAGSTNTGDAFVRAQELFASAGKNSNARKVFVILTDGLATGPGDEPEAYAQAKAELLKQSGAEVYAIGLGQQVNMNFVRSIASDGQSYQALSRSQVDSIYREITGAICEDGAAVIDIVPKSNSNFPTFR